MQDIVGQDAAISQLQRAMHGGRLPHAFIFAGPAGVGRRTTAVALANALLCASPVDEEGPAGPLRRQCGQCEDCRMTAAGSHGDFHMVYKELARYHEDASVRSRVMQELGIDVIRSFLLAPAGRRPSRGRAKVFVVKEAELLSIAAQNSLLKTLEEPPPGVVIVLICSSPQRLLPTTLSRCAMVRFGLLPRQFVTDKLISGGVDADQARFWAGFTAGSVGRAQRLAEAGMYELKCDVVERLGAVPSVGDTELGEYLAKAADKLATAAVAAAKKRDGASLSKTLAGRRAAGEMLELIAAAYSDAMALACGADAPPVNVDQLQAIRAIATRFEPAQLAEIVQSIGRCEQLLWRNANSRIVWDNVVIACSAAHPLGV